jgi:hypothetical protein
MEKYALFNRKNLLIAGLSALALLATAGCQRLKPIKIEPIYYDSQQAYNSDNIRNYDITDPGSFLSKNLLEAYVGVKIRF